MKNRWKNILVATVSGMLVFAAFAIDIVPTSEARAQEIVKKDNRKVAATLVAGVQEDGIYTRVDVSALPQIVRSAVLSKYVAYSVMEAFEGNDGTCKLVLKNGKSKLVVIYDESGEFIRQEAVKAVEMIALL